MRETKPRSAAKRVRAISGGATQQAIGLSLGSARDQALFAEKRTHLLDSGVGVRQDQLGGPEVVVGYAFTDFAY
jgi:hypothetical protein